MKTMGILIMLLLSSLLLFVTPAIGSVTLPFLEDFERYNVGYSPGYPWFALEFPTRITTCDAHSGLKSVEVRGGPSAARNALIDLGTDYPDLIGYEVWVKVNDLNSGVFVGFLEQIYNMVPRFNTINLHNGKIYFYSADSDSPVYVDLNKSVQAGEWLKVRAELNFQTLKGYVYLNDTLIGDGIPISPKNAVWRNGGDHFVSLRNVGFIHEYGQSVLVDDFSVFQWESNHPPTSESIGNITTEEGVPVEFTINAADPDGNSLSYSAGSLPYGASFDPETHAFSWTPGFNQCGNYSITFEVTDDGNPPLTTSPTVEIDVLDVPSSSSFVKNLKNIMMREKYPPGLVNGGLNHLKRAITFDGRRKYNESLEQISALTAQLREKMPAVYDLNEEFPVGFDVRIQENGGPWHTTTYVFQLSPNNVKQIREDLRADIAYAFLTLYTILKNEGLANDAQWCDAMMIVAIKYAYDLRRLTSLATEGDYVYNRIEFLDWIRDYLTTTPLGILKDAWAMVDGINIFLTPVPPGAWENFLWVPFPE